MTAQVAEALVMMRCERRDMILSTAGCARLYRKAQGGDTQDWYSRSTCQFCPVGAALAGVEIAPMAEAVQSLTRHCSRCQKPTNRRINGLFCPSCYNRDREARVGCNRKGTVPRKILSALHTAHIVVAGPDGVRSASLPRVAARTEAMALLARESTQPMSFGVPPLQLDQHV